jgi:hypothetical protein
MMMIMTINAQYGNKAARRDGSWGDLEPTIEKQQLEGECRMVARKGVCLLFEREAES